MAKVHFGSGIVHKLHYAGDPYIYKRTLPSESFIRKPCAVSELRTELEALKESPELTVQLKLFGR